MPAVRLDAWARLPIACAHLCIACFRISLVFLIGYHSMRWVLFAFKARERIEAVSL